MHSTFIVFTILLLIDGSCVASSYNGYRKLLAVEINGEGGSETQKGDPNASTGKKDLSSQKEIQDTHPLNNTSTEAGKNVTAPDTDILKKFKPGATRRGLLVFSGTVLFALLYFGSKYYWKTRKRAENPNAFKPNDAAQFRYGVLETDDTENMEFSSMPLTMESEDEEDEIDLFNLEQRKKVLYENYISNPTLQNKGTPVKDNAISEDNKQPLLLDIEGTSSREADTDTKLGFT